MTVYYEVYAGTVLTVPARAHWCWCWCIVAMRPRVELLSAVCRLPIHSLLLPFALHLDTYVLSPPPNAAAAAAAAAPSALGVQPSRWPHRSRQAGSRLNTMTSAGRCAWRLRVHLPRLSTSSPQGLSASLPARQPACPVCPGCPARAHIHTHKYTRHTERTRARSTSISTASRPPDHAWGKFVKSQSHAARITGA